MGEYLPVKLAPSAVVNVSLDKLFLYHDPIDREVCLLYFTIRMECGLYCM